MSWSFLWLSNPEQDFLPPSSPSARMWIFFATKSVWQDAIGPIWMPRVGAPVSHPLFPFSDPPPSSLPSILKKWFIMGGGFVKGGFSLPPNQFNRLQMVQFECTRVRNLCLSPTFGEIPFPIFSPCSFLPSSLPSLKKFFIMGGCVKGGHFCNQISSTGCKWSSLKDPGWGTPRYHPPWGRLRSTVRAPFSFRQRTYDVVLARVFRLR